MWRAPLHFYCRIISSKASKEGTIMTESTLHRAGVTAALAAVVAASFAAAFVPVQAAQAKPPDTVCEEEDLKYTAFDCDDVEAARKANAVPVTERVSAEVCAAPTVPPAANVNERIKWRGPLDIVTPR
jgi:hypothetical protein